MNTIRQLRCASGLTQQQPPVCVGVTSTTVHNWKRGQRAPQVAHLWALAKVFGCRMDDITLMGPRKEATV